MSEEDFLELVELVQSLLLDAGHAAIADDAAQLIIEYPDEPAYLPRAKKHLITLLEDFNAMLVRHDVSTLKTSLATISETVQGEGPKTAMFEFQSREGRESVERNLAEEPDFSELRQELSRLIGRIKETPEDFDDR